MTAFAYDAAADLVSSTIQGYTGNPSNPVPPQNLVETSRAYDPAGRLASVTNVLGTTTSYTYYDNNPLHPPTSSSPAALTPPQHVTTYGYDAAGNQVTETDPGGLVTSSVYNPASQPVSKTQDPSGTNLITTASYDANGNVVTQHARSQGGSTRTTTATYNALGQALSRTVHKTGSTNLTSTENRDQRGLVISVTNPGGQHHPSRQRRGRADHSGEWPTRQCRRRPVPAAAPVTANPVAMVGYDTFGDQVESSNAGGNVTTTAYDTDGQRGFGHRSFLHPARIQHARQWHHHHDL